MHFSTATALVAALALASAQTATAQDSSPAGQGASSSHASASGSAQGQSSAGSSARANGTATSSASSGASTAAAVSTNNPLIPATVSAKCESFLTYLNSHGDVASCTAPLLSAVSLFQASSGSNAYNTDAAAVQDALSGLCYSSACDDALVRSLLTQFNGNCSSELTAANSVVLGSYDALYVLTPLRDAVCATDANADFCINDIAQGTMPAGSTGANATAVVSSVASSYAAAATASIAGNATNATAAAAPAQNVRILATAQQQAYEIAVPAPASLYFQVSGALKRFVRRQWSGEGGSSSGSASGSGSSSAAKASASAGGNSTTASNATSSSSSSSSSQGDSAGAPSSGVHSFSVPSILPNADTWSSSSLPFLFLSPSMSSTVLCSQCTKSILSAYIAFESRMPYAVGLANSPLLKGQGALWTATGEKCGGGFLESVAKQAGETNLTGGAGASRAVGALGVGAAVMLAVLMLAA
ncbi:hypothetical protein JCM10450v2_008166 [Rhodotorula kratochvilovae]